MLPCTMRADVTAVCRAGESPVRPAPVRGAGRTLTSMTSLSSSARDIPLTTIDGATASLHDYDDKALLIVNVASRCGLSPQYEALEQLQQRYGGRGFTVLGFPSNQFLQELGSEDAIKEYCSTTWGVTFPMFERIKVNGKSAHPLYQELKKTPDASGKAGRVTWNFEKFLLTPDGEVIRFRPKTEPDDPTVIGAIEAALPASAA